MAAKKKTGIVDSFNFRCSSGTATDPNEVNGLGSQSPYLRMDDAEGNDVVRVEMGGKNDEEVVVSIGDVTLRVRRPVSKEEKRRNQDYLVVVESGLDESTVFLGPHAGAVLPGGET